MSKAAIYLLLSLVSTAKLTSASRSYSIHLNEGLEGQTLLDPREDSPVLVFGYCHNGQCIFFREREISGNSFDSSAHLRSCSFAFDDGQVLELYPFGSDKIVFAYEVRENSNKRFGILNLSSCQSRVARIDADAKMTRARVMCGNETSFEIAVNNWGSDELCREKMCKMTVNEDGYALTNLTQWIDDADYRSVAYSSLGGYVVVDADIAARRLLVYTAYDGEVRSRIMANYTSHLVPPVSSTHGFVTTCGTTESLIKCWQFDERRQDTPETLLVYKDVKQVKLHNLPGGGFLLLTSKCQKYSLTCEDPVAHFFVTRVSSEGKIEGHFRVTEFTADSYFLLNNVHFFEKDDGAELCFSSVHKRFLRSKDEQIVEIFCYKSDHVNFRK